MKVAEATDKQASTYYSRLLEGALSKSVGDSDVRIVPHPGVLFVKPDDPESETKGGLIIPESAAQQRDTGIVVAVAPDEKRYKEGDRVLYRKTAEMVTLEGVGELIILQTWDGIESSILAKLEPEYDPTTCYNCGKDLLSGPATTIQVAVGDRSFCKECAFGKDPSLRIPPQTDDKKD